jgi:hypothetical protein
MGSKLNDGNSPMKNVPGPGQYDTQHVDNLNMNFAAKWKFGSSNRLPLVNAKNVPGPGNYESSLADKKVAPKYGFGSSNRDAIKDMNSTFPGPGQYKLNGIVGNDGPGILMHSKLSDNKKMNTPGPGQYETPLKLKKNSPAYRQGTEKRTSSQVNTISPPPNAYNPTTQFTSKASAKWGFGTEKRKNTASNLSPGPGNYELGSSAFSNKFKFHMGQKLDDNKDKMQVPGAGQYDPDYKAVTKSLPKYSMKARFNTLTDKMNVPGPG